MAKQNKLREQMAKDFLAVLNQGKLPWESCWQKFRPYNGTSGRRYTGINSVFLSRVADEKGYTDPRWCTYKQAQDKGWQVRKGEKSTPVEYWAWYDRLQRRLLPWSEARPLLGTDYQDQHMQLKCIEYNVFNAEQMDGVPALQKRQQTDIGALREKRDTLIRNMGVSYEEKGNDAFYTPGADTITLPPESNFNDTYSYMGTLLHEAGHATGHPSRLNRDLSGTFGSESYAKEELRAEIASAFTAQSIGLQLTPAQQKYHMDLHKAYIQNWADIIKDAPKELFNAIQDAEKISDYLLEKGEFEVEEIPEELTAEDAAEEITAIVIDPEQKPVVQRIGSSLADLQALIGGDVTLTDPGNGDPVTYVSSLQAEDLPLNRGIVTGDSASNFVMQGRFMIVGFQDGKIQSLPDELVEKYTNQFRMPERFIRYDDRADAIQIRDGITKPEGMLYRVEANPRSDAAYNSHIVQAYAQNAYGRLEVGEVLYIGTPDLCRQFQAILEDGIITHKEAKWLCQRDIRNAMDQEIRNAQKQAAEEEVDEEDIAVSAVVRHDLAEAVDEQHSKGLAFLLYGKEALSMATEVALLDEAEMEARKDMISGMTADQKIVVSAMETAGFMLNTGLTVASADGTYAKIVFGGQGNVSPIEFNSWESAYAWIDGFQGKSNPGLREQVQAILHPVQTDMLAVVVEPGMPSKIQRIGNGLADLQALVGGTLQAVYPYDDPVAILCNDNGKLDGMELNRVLRDEHGRPYDIIAGRFAVVGLTDDNFGGLSPELANKYAALFHSPEAFIQTGRGIQIVRVPDEAITLDPDADGWNELTATARWRVEEVENGLRLHISGEGAMPDYLFNQERPYQAYAGKITEVQVDDGIRTIGARAFYRMPELQTVSLPQSVNAVDYLAMDDCEKLEQVRFGGTAEEWAAVTKGWNYLPYQFTEQDFQIRAAAIQEHPEQKDTYISVAARKDADSRRETVSSDFTKDAVVRSDGSGSGIRIVSNDFRLESLDLSKASQRQETQEMETKTASQNSPQIPTPTSEDFEME